MLRLRRVFVYFCFVWLKVTPSGRRSPSTYQAPVDRRLDNSIYWIELYPVDNVMRFAITYPVDTYIISNSKVIDPECLV